MEFNSKFDERIEVIRRIIPDKLHEAYIFVNDSLEICWISAVEIYGDKVKPEHAFEIYDRIIKRSGIRTKADFDTALKEDCSEIENE